jgi:hypothetical protein
MLSSAAHAQSQNLFFRPPAYPIGGQTVTADFNGDGKPDLVTVDGTVLLGKGDGTFTVGTHWSLGPRISVSAIATGDFNGDGKPDLVVSASPFLYVLLGNGDGTFRAGTGTNLGTGLNQIVVADVNGDGKADVIGIGPVIFVLLGNGSGSFTSNSTYPLLSPCPS